MDNIIKVSKISRLKSSLKDKRVVLAGGCFDILHPGHIVFLQKAKKEGEVLIILLEPDERLKQLKGEKRPVHRQIERAKILTALRFVDFVIMLPVFKNEKDYDEIVLKLKPAIIAATSNDPQSHHKKRTAKLAGAKLKFVTRIVGNYSSSRILQR